jgi:hypothetical protein
MLVRYAPIRGIPFPFKDLLPSEEAPLSRSCSRHSPVGGGSSFQVLLPWEEVPFKGLLPWEEVTSRSCSHGKKSRPGLAPVGGGSPSRSCSRGRRLPFPGPAPVGGGYPFQVLLPWEEVPFKGLLPWE